VSLHVDAGFLLRVAEDLGFPSVSIDSLQIGGEGGWRAALLTRVPPLTPGERGRVPPMPKLLLQRWVADRVLVFGDDDLAGPIAHAVATMPAPLRDLATEEVCWLGVGRGLTGWAGSSNLGDREGIRPYLVQVSGAGSDEDVGRICAHELGHLWHRSESHLAECVLSVVGERRLRDHLRRQNSAALAIARAFHEADERRARAIEMIWTIRHGSDRTA
jgi:hypothetical protein